MNIKMKLKKVYILIYIEACTQDSMMGKEAGEASGNPLATGAKGGWRFDGPRDVSRGTGMLLGGDLMGPRDVSRGTRTCSLEVGS